jgi:hypothetical protein
MATQTMSRTSNRKKASPGAYSIAQGGVRPAVITALDAEDPARVHVRTASAGERGFGAAARIALAAPYRPSEGDRVLVAVDGDDLYVIGVLHAKEPASLPLPGGGSVAVRGEGAEIRDAEGRLLVRYENGAASIAAPDGDLSIEAPRGRVIVRAGQGIALQAEGDIEQVARGSVALRAGGEEGASALEMGSAEARIETTRLSVKAEDTSVTTQQATVIARRIATTATALTQTVERYELNATRLIERARDTFREASELAQTSAGRVRMLVKDTYFMRSRRTSMTSAEDTSIDGSKILLG